MKWPAFLEGRIFTISFKFGGGHTKFDVEQFVADGKKLIGKPYKFGDKPDWKIPPELVVDLDCSGLVCYLFGRVGISVVEGSYNQANACNKLIGDELLVGDLLFKWIPETGVIHHVGVYLGDRQVLEAKGKAWGVILTPLATFMGSPQYAWAGRLKVLCDDKSV